MRSPRELSYRIRQELQNLRLWIAPPALTADPASPLPGLPGPAAIRATVAGTGLADEIVRIADSILRRRFPLLGCEIETGPEIDWRRDYVHGRSSPLRYFRFIPYLNFQAVGDHKFVWELNRHQHLVLLAQAALVTGDDTYETDLFRQLESWMAQNPFQRGINWTSALEVAFRALSWTWIYHLHGSRMTPDFRKRFLRLLYLHGRYIETNLSYYYSPNTHLLGEAVALHALGKLFPAFLRSRRWATLGREITQREMGRQVRDDGSHFEQSSYYTLYAFDMFLFHAVLDDPPAAYRERLGRMAAYLDALAGPTGRLPLLGDEDGGRFFHPFGRQKMRIFAPLGGLNRGISASWAAFNVYFYRSESIPSAALARPESQLFRDSGVAVLRAGENQIVIDCGPFGPGNSTHSHSDTLSFTASAGTREILIDPGTFTYSDPLLREEFRGSAAHNTIRIDSLDQAMPDGPFRWKQQPEVAVLDWKSTPEKDALTAECRYRGFTHRRRFLFVKPDLLLIVDEVQGSPEEHLVEQFWHPASEESICSIFLSDRAEITSGWRSIAYGQRAPAPVLCVRKTTELPFRLAAAIFLGDPADVSVTFDIGQMNISVMRNETCVCYRFD